MAAPATRYISFYPPLAFFVFSYFRVFRDSIPCRSNMAGSSLEERVTALESQVAHLRDHILDQGVKKEGWEAIVGTFLNDPYYEKAMKYGRQYRESLRPKKKKKKK